MNGPEFNVFLAQQITQAYILKVRGEYDDGAFLRLRPKGIHHCGSIFLILNGCKATANDLSNAVQHKRRDNIALYRSQHRRCASDYPTCGSTRLEKNVKRVFMLSAKEEQGTRWNTWKRTV